MKNLKFLACLLLFFITLNDLTASTQSQPVILVLGSGGSRGLAHVGVIEELEKLGIIPDAIVGCSSGAIVGALYAQHRDIAKVKGILMNLKQEDLIDWSLFEKRALSSTKKLKKFLKENLPSNDFSGLQIPFVAVATDLHEGEPVYLKEGKLHAALLASSALPGLFHPHEIRKQLYVDGGISDPLPVQFAHKWRKGIVIASDISPSLKQFEVDNMIQVLRKSFEICYQRLADTSRKKADILLMMNFEDVDSPIDDGVNHKLYEKGKEIVRSHSKEIIKKISKDD